MSRRNKQGRSGDPAAFARQAMLAVLSRAQASGDDDRILAAAKSVLAAHGSLAAAGTQAQDSLGFTLDELNLEEKQQMQDLIRDVQLLKNRVRARLGRAQEGIPQFYFEKVQAPRNEPPVVHPPEPPASAPTAPKPAPVAKEEEPVTEQPDPLDTYYTGEPVEWAPPREVKR